MLFHSWTFLLFFITVYALFLLAKNRSWKRNIILAASFIFYGWWNPLYLLIISWVILFDFHSMYFMEKTGRKKLFLTLCVMDVLIILGIFKYSAFIVNNLNMILNSTGAGYAIPQPGILFPAGISFFMFMSLGNIIDFYRGKTGREKSLVRYASFVSFFPSLLAGPIERGNRLLPLINSWPEVTKDDVAEGVYLFIRGLFKKAALADYFALYADKIFANPAQYTSGDLIAGALAFTWQIYFDFSGYTDMARGVARTLGINLMENFNLPYMASGTGDFWRRWHISLSSWFRDYVYITLGGSRKGGVTESRNVFAAMLLSGFWHGAAWNFILWGFLHAVLHSAGKLLAEVKTMAKIPLPLKRIFFFILIVFTWIFFKSENAGDALIFTERIFSTELAAPQMPVYMALLIAASYAIHWLGEYGKMEFTARTPVRAASVLIMIAYMLIFVTGSSGGFIYFQF